MPYHQIQKGFGLGVLNPKLSLLIVIISTSLFAFIKTIEVSFIAIAFSILILILGKRLVFKKIFFYVLIVNTIYMILGNWLFSPNTTINDNYLIFRINNEGLYYGIVGALKRNAMTILSFAWLSSVDSLYDVYKSINISKRFDKTIIIFLKWVQNLRHVFILLYYSIYLRGFDLKSKNPRKKIQQLNIVLKAILNRFFTDIGKMTFNSESHFNNLENNDNSFEGSINIKNLKVAYEFGSKIILDNINLEIEEGEVVFITGNNESGKTTLLKIISGYIPKIEGVILKGDVIVSKKSHNSDISLNEINKYLRFIVDNPADSIIGLTVEQELHSQTSEIDKIHVYSKLLDIAHLWKRDTNSLSGGEQARVVLASLLCSNTKILVLESPLSQLDPLGRDSFISALLRLKKSKNTTIIITDQFADAYKDLITRIICIENGMIKKDIRLNYNYFYQYFTTLINSFPTLEKFNNRHLSTIKVVSITHLSVSFDNKNVLSNINCEFYQNQCIAILGDNGSGKSTLLLTIAKVLNPSRGNVQLYGNKVGLLFQDSSKQILEDKVGEEIISGLKNELVDEEFQNKYKSEMLEWSELNEFQSTIDLSASKIKLLEIASNIYNKDIIIFDEPTTFLDSFNITKLHSLIQKLLKNGKTVIIVTHDTYFASLCNRYILLHKSKILIDTNNFNEVLQRRNSLNYA